MTVGGHQALTSTCRLVRRAMIRSETRDLVFDDPLIEQPLEIRPLNRLPGSASAVRNAEFYHNRGECLSAPAFPLDIFDVSRRSACAWDAMSCC
jgi:hypothetical protein